MDRHVLLLLLVHLLLVLQLRNRFAAELCMLSHPLHYCTYTSVEKKGKRKKEKDCFGLILAAYSMPIVDEGGG
ncbi:hypothetical protein F5B17DRAFT_403031 [Nemania serpens]|nr:hypothetical protein F5B17DRAFT_403031 [Nemania serpens]